MIVGPRSTNLSISPKDEDKRAPRLDSTHRTTPETMSFRLLRIDLPNPVCRSDAAYRLSSLLASYFYYLPSQLQTFPTSEDKSGDTTLHEVLISIKREQCNRRRRGMDETRKRARIESEEDVSAPAVKAPQSPQSADAAAAATKIAESQRRRRELEAKVNALQAENKSLTSAGAATPGRRSSGRLLSATRGHEMQAGVRTHKPNFREDKEPPETDPAASTFHGFHFHSSTATSRRERRQATPETLVPPPSGYASPPRSITGQTKSGERVSVGQRRRGGAMKELRKRARTGNYKVADAPAAEAPELLNPAQLKKWQQKLPLFVRVHSRVPLHYVG
ncbi:hypothetical protein THAOC_02980 [Thalassiosira oceanica]|uniref:Uncharacterized protein n=1 Tax=Thalassiosira oceanica TaxID=159749 RepID=K0TD02_THAOC|nr:hypothetical protein THAOC_02980 [Thalassiosira oceanica]|eukprot:EJK75300.1 hypothetical protein THAOC_02980 [Thalassiosira oceanica]